MASVSNELVKRDAAVLTPAHQNITEVQRLGNILAASGYFADAREMAQAAVKVMAGQELGIPPVAAMMGISIIKGKVALGANLIASRVRAHGYEYHHKRFDDKGCTLEFLSRADFGGKRKVLGESSFTEEDAKAAGCFSEMYKKYPRNMYFARAISNGARWYTPEVFNGAPVYVPEELGAKVDGDGNVVHDEPPKPTPQQVAEAKVDQMKQGVPYADTTPEPKPEQMKGGIKDWLKHFQTVKERVGPEAYYRILGANGVEHANEIKSREQAKTIYTEILQYEQDRAAAEAGK